jgi:hypothetical protein
MPSHSTLQLLMHYLSLLWIVVFMLQKVVMKIFLSRLHARHTATWEQLGEPVTFMPTSKFIKFLWRRDYNALPDDRLVVFGRSLRFFWICHTVLWVSLVVLIIYMAECVPHFWKHL